MYVGRDFDEATTTETEPFGFDFVKEIDAGDAIVSATWSCTVAERSTANDTAPATRLTGTPIISGTHVYQVVNGLLPGVTYLMRADAVTRHGYTKTLWSYVLCRRAA